MPGGVVSGVAFQAATDATPWAPATGRTPGGVAVPRAVGAEDSSWPGAEPASAPELPSSKGSAPVSPAASTGDCPVSSDEEGPVCGEEGPVCGEAPGTGTAADATAGCGVVACGAGVADWAGSSGFGGVQPGPAPYGGCGDASCGEQLDDTWRFDGERWEQVDTGASEGMRPGGMAHDSARARTLRLGEGASWRWTGTTWSPGDAAEPALGRFALAELPGTGLSLFGGLTSKGVESDETWVLRCL